MTLLTVCHWRHSAGNWKLFCFLYHYHDYICLFSGPWGFYLGRFKNFIWTYVCMYVTDNVNVLVVFPVWRHWLAKCEHVFRCHFQTLLQQFAHCLLPPIFKWVWLIIIKDRRRAVCFHLIFKSESVTVKRCTKKRLVSCWWYTYVHIDIHKKFSKWPK